MKRQGFILAEVAIAVSIVAILAGVIAPKVNEYFIIKRIERTALTFQQIGEAVRLYRANNAAWPTLANLQAGATPYLPAGWTPLTGWGGAITLDNTNPNLYRISATLPTNFEHSLDGYLGLVSVSGATTTMYVPLPEAVPLTANFVSKTTDNTLQAGVDITMGSGSTITGQEMRAGRLTVSPTTAPAVDTSHVTLGLPSAKNVKLTAKYEPVTYTDPVTMVTSTRNISSLWITPTTYGTKSFIFDVENGRLGVNGYPWDYEVQVKGSISASDTVQAVKVLFTSDARMKNIESRLTNVMPRLLRIGGYRYSFKEYRPDRLNLGLLAQEVREQFPELVDTAPGGMLTIDYAGFTPVLLEAIRELDGSVGDLRKLVRLENERVVVSSDGANSLGTFTASKSADPAARGSLSVGDVYLTGSGKWVGAGLSLVPDERLVWEPGSPRLELGEGRRGSGVVVDVRGAAGSSAVIRAGEKVWRVAPGQWTLLADGEFSVSAATIDEVRLVGWLQ